MIRFESSYKVRLFMASLFVCLIAAGGIETVFAAVDPGIAVAPGTFAGATTEPTVISSSPMNWATKVSTSINSGDNVVSGTVVTATFSEAMDAATLTSSSSSSSTENLPTFTVKETTGDDVAGSVVMDEANTVATFTPALSALKPNTSYTATIT